jgi:Resolvase, N terminal domain
MERPAFQRLLSDVSAGKIDVVVVYKVDRLTRSLSDFAKIVDIFDKHAKTSMWDANEWDTAAKKLNDHVGTKLSNLFAKRLKLLDPCSPLGSAMVALSM